MQGEILNKIDIFFSILKNLKKKSEIFIQKKFFVEIFFSKNSSCINAPR